MSKIIEKNKLIILASLTIILAVLIAFFISMGGNLTNYSWDRSITKLQKQSSSTEIADIEKDLEDTNLTELDKELEEIEKELDEAVTNL